jgi:hypothetical protein
MSATLRLAQQPGWVHSDLRGWPVRRGRRPVRSRPASPEADHHSRQRPPTHQLPHDGRILERPDRPHRHLLRRPVAPLTTPGAPAPPAHDRAQWLHAHGRTTGRPFTSRSRTQMDIARATLRPASPGCALRRRPQRNVALRVPTIVYGPAVGRVEPASSTIEPVGAFEVEEETARPVRARQSSSRAWTAARRCSRLHDLSADLAVQVLLGVDVDVGLAVVEVFDPGRADFRAALDR